MNVEVVLAGGLGSLASPAASLLSGMGTAWGEAVAVARAAKTYLVEDADAAMEPAGTRAVFPGTLQGLLDALDAARYRSAAGSPKAVVIVEGGQRKIIRRFENGTEAWSASRAEIRLGRANGPKS